MLFFVGLIVGLLLAFAFFSKSKTRKNNHFEGI
jgi:hypothetical protein